jgi:hypothetical protein
LLVPSRIGSQTMSCTARSSPALAGIGSPLGSRPVACQLACQARVVDLSIFEKSGFYISEVSKKWSQQKGEVLQKRNIHRGNFNRRKKLAN